MIVMLSLFSGWASPVDTFGDDSHKGPEKTQKNKSVFHSSYYLKKAMTYKNKDELQLALFFLKIAAALSPSDKEIAGKITDLKLTIDRKSNNYFKKGEKFLSQNNTEEARNQFLTVLRYDPDNKGALEYLKNKLIPKEYINYTFEQNDSLKTISNKFYKNPELVSLIVYFNNLKPDAKPKPGQILKIPILEKEFYQAIDDRRQDLILANNLLKEKRFQKVVVITRKILKNDPLNKKAIKLKDEALYRIGIRLISQEKYFEAIDTFKKTTPGHEDVDDLIQEAIQHELLKAKTLLKGKKYEESMNLAKKILAYDKSNTAANKLISTSFCQQGRDLLIQKKYDEALSVLDKADPAEFCVKKTRIAVKNAIKQQAEAHYIQGVKHFLNEDLQLAIEEWEKALKLNPNHDKAKKNIKNARSLLEKLKKVK
jgi:tetratricopeptide (TPR) repeat protein